MHTMLIDNTISTLSIVAPDEPANPGDIKSDQIGSLGWCMASRHQPQDVPAAGFFRISTRAVACVERIGRQMRLQYK